MLLSCAIEGPIAFVLVQLAGWPCRGPLHIAIAAMLATAATHPQLWAAVIWLTPHLGYEPALAILEAAVVVFEAAAIAWAGGLALSRALVVSLVANAGSFAVGLLLA